MIYLTPYSNVIRHELETGGLGLLITPQSHRPAQYDVDEFSYWAADNGCFTLGDRFDLGAYLEWLDSFTFAERLSCLFATAPDVVGDWQATLRRSAPVLDDLRELSFPAGIVLQDGAVPADLRAIAGDVDAVFVGGSTEWKLSDEAAGLGRLAAELGLWVHMGRVNSRRRVFAAARAEAYSADGTYLLFGPDVNGPKLRRWVDEAGLEFGAVDFDTPAEHHPEAGRHELAAAGELGRIAA